jgi:dTDP-4-dehydrorhamnose 3,5-epimerase
VRFEPLGIDGAWSVTPVIHEDQRGSFLEWFRADEVSRIAGRPMEIAQANCSVSRLGVIRGIHFADVPPGQSKYITCVSGAILDVVVDLRVGSPTFGRWEAVRLCEETRGATYLAEGLGHAFMTLTEQATVVYLSSSFHRPSREHGVHPMDPKIGIEWPTGINVILSRSDLAAPSLDEACRAGLLPAYDEILALRSGPGRR